MHLDRRAIEAAAVPAPAAAPVVALHSTANGASVATITGNDNAASPAKPKRARRAAPVEASELDALKARLAAAVAAGHSVKAIAKVADVNDAGLIQWRKGKAGLGPMVAGKLDVALTTLGH